METPGFTNLHNIEKYFTDNETCWKYLEASRWNNNPACPHCASTAYYPVKNRKVFKCKDCQKFYNVLTGTIFENTKIPLLVWFKAIYILTSHKKGISSIQLGKDLGITQKSAWFVLGRIRNLAKEKVPFMLTDTCEVDETYIGGKERNKHQSLKAKKKRAEKRISNGETWVDDKTIVFGLLQRDGKVVNVVVPDTCSDTLLPIIRKHIKKKSTMYSDDNNVYRNLTKLGYTHEYVQHNIHEYVRGDVHTSNIDGYWSNLKRGIIGVYHQVSPKHLHRYCNEFSFRYNTRDLNEVERFKSALNRVDKTRLRYSKLINK